MKLMTMTATCSAIQSQYSFSTKAVKIVSGGMDIFQKRMAQSVISINYGNKRFVTRSREAFNINQVI